MKIKTITRNQQRRKLIRYRSHVDPMLKNLVYMQRCKKVLKIIESLCKGKNENE